MRGPRRGRRRLPDQAVLARRAARAAARAGAARPGRAPDGPGGRRPAARPGHPRRSGAARPRSSCRPASSRCSRRSCAAPARCFSQPQLLEAAWDLGYEQRSNVVEVYVRYLRAEDRPAVRGQLARDGARARLPAAQGRRRSEPAADPRPADGRVRAGDGRCVLAGAGLFVYLRLQRRPRREHRRRPAARGPQRSRRARARPRRGAAGDQRGGLRAAAGPGRRVLDRLGRPARRALSAAELQRHGAGAGRSSSAGLPGIEGTTRVLARRRRPRLGRSWSPSASRSTTATRRSPASSRSFAIGGPIAVLLASLARLRARHGGPAAGRGDAPARGRRSRSSRRRAAPAARRPTTRSAGSARRSTRCSIGCASFERERRFVADASHELRTPLAVIKTELEGALRAGDPARQVREALVAAVEECDHLAQLAEDLLVLARAGEGELPVRPEPLEARGCSTACAQRFADRAARARPRRSGWTCRRQLVVRATSCGCARRSATSSTTRCATARATSRCARAARRGRRRDRGQRPGRRLRADFADRAFERFARGDERARAAAPGLGLAIVRAIAEAHGGRARSSTGAGATVRLWLPRTPCSQPARRGARGRASDRHGAGLS